MSTTYGTSETATKSNRAKPTPMPTSQAMPAAELRERPPSRIRITNGARTMATTMARPIEATTFQMSEPR